MAAFRELGKRVIIIFVPSTCFVCSHLTHLLNQVAGDVFCLRSSGKEWSFFL
jgi:hypothetical protein